MSAADSNHDALVFAFFNEIGIINQLSSSVFQRCMPDGLHISHFSVLNHLQRLGDGRTPQQITEAFQVTKGTMTHTLNTLVGRGFITMEPHATDRRSKCVFLTDSGREFHRTAIAALAVSMKRLQDEFGTESLAEVLPALKALRSYLDENRDL